jgi:hypothetical protein
MNKDDDSTHHTTSADDTSQVSYIMEVDSTIMHPQIRDFLRREWNKMMRCTHG